MVKLTLEAIARATSRHTQRRKDETIQQFLCRLTHLYLENKNIDSVGDDLCLCRSLLVLYMYDNQLTEVPCLNNSTNLTHLYLQGNNISKIMNLSSLPRLQKLFLGGNVITVLEGLEKLQQLQELHVENQRHSHGEHLLFDPRSIQAISETLQVLNISGNNLSSISELEKLSKLTQLIAGNNKMNDMKELAHLLPSWRFLWRLDLAGNPLCQNPKYKDQIIVMAKNLEILDAKTITATERQFLLSWQAIRDLHAKRSQDNLMRLDTFSSFSSELAGGRNLPPARSTTRLQAGLSAPAKPGLPRQQYSANLNKYNTPELSKHRTARSGVLQTNFNQSQDTHLNDPCLVFRRNVQRPLSIERIYLKHSAHKR